MGEDAKNFLNNYGDFVTKVTSEPSLQFRCPHEGN